MFDRSFRLALKAIVLLVLGLYAISPCYSVVYVTTIKGQTQDGKSWATAYNTVAAALTDAGARADEVWVAQGTYKETITVPAGVKLFGGFNGTEITRSARNANIHVTTIQGTKSGATVTFATGVTQATMIDGFRITYGGSQGGVYCVAGASPVISGNVVRDGVGYGINCTGTASSPVIVNNVIAFNLGGGIIAGSGCNPIITNNTLVANNSLSTGAKQYGINAANSTAKICNNIIAGSYYGLSQPAGVAHTYNCVCGAVPYYGSATKGTGEFTLDPKLCKVGDTYRIAPDSPCRDAGTSVAYGVPAIDIDGQPRPEGGAVDIGADESYSDTYEQRIIRVKPTSNQDGPGDTWDHAWRSITKALAVATWGDEVWVAQSSYAEKIYVQPGVSLYGGFSGDETLRSQRDFACPTIIDYQSTTGLVTFAGGTTPGSVLDGFTLKHCGSSTGTVDLQYASPTITNNTIADSLGSGIFCAGSLAVIAGNTITGCKMSGVVVQYSTLIITNNTILDCGTTNASPGIWSDSSSLGSKVSNNIICFNGYGISGYTGLALSHNCVYGNKGSNYQIISAGATDISKDPRVIINTATGAAHIQAYSPCRNAGDNSALCIPTVDVDRQARIDGPAVDIGVDESYGESCPVNIIRVKPNSLINGPGNDWDHACHTISQAVAASTHNTEIWVAAGTYAESITPGDTTALYGGFAGTESLRDQRNPAVNRSIVTGSYTTTCVTFNGVGPTTIIDGFDITNFAGNGGIVCLAAAAPTISNNVVKNGSQPGINGVTGGAVVIVNNRLTGISAPAILCGTNAATIVNNTIVGNPSYGISFQTGTPTAIVTNNIVAFNSYGIPGGVVASFGRNCVYGNTTADYYTNPARPGDINSDPMLINWSSGDFHILSTSPCRDAGDSWVPGLPAVDMDGQNRIDNFFVDMGADESYGEQPAAPFIDSGIAFSNAGPSQLAWGDFDSDGKLDMALTGYSSQPFACILRNTGTGMQDISAAISGAYSGAVAWADFDRDGDLDLAVAGYIAFSDCATRIYRNDNGVFSDLQAGLPGVHDCALAWADIDNDGDLDLAIAGLMENGTCICRIYRNDGGTFTDTHTADELPGFRLPALAWADFDGNGFLDLIATGEVSSNPTSQAQTRIYLNTAGHLTATMPPIVGVSGGRACGIAVADFNADSHPDVVISGQSVTGPVTKLYYSMPGSGWTEAKDTTFVGLSDCSVTVGDYDNNGYTDFAVAGLTSDDVPTFKLYSNDSGSTFSEVNSGIPGLGRSSIAFGDYNGDGKLDLAISGCDEYVFSRADHFITRIYTNVGPTANQRPSAPTTLPASVNGSGAGLSWTQSTDDKTPASSLTYNVRIGSASGKADIVSPMSLLSTGNRLLPAWGNAGSALQRFCAPLPAGRYYWSVQAIDSAYGASAWAQEGTFDIDSSMPFHDAKWAALGQTVCASGVVSAVYDGFFYVGPSNRCEGVRVDYKGKMPEVGRVVAFSGLPCTDQTNEEPYIQADLVIPGDTDPLGPLFMQGKQLGGGPVGRFPGVEGLSGVSNIGLLVKTIGKVTQIDPAGAYFYINDGSELKDGTKTGDEDNLGVRVAFDGSGYTKDQLLTITGTSCCFKDNDKLHRMLRVQKASDIE